MASEDREYELERLMEAIVQIDTNAAFLVNRYFWSESSRLAFDTRNPLRPDWVRSTDFTPEQSLGNCLVYAIDLSSSASQIVRFKKVLKTFGVLPATTAVKFVLDTEHEAEIQVGPGAGFSMHAAVSHTQVDGHSSYGVGIVHFMLQEYRASGDILAHAAAMQTSSTRTKPLMHACPSWGCNGRALLHQHHVFHVLCVCT